MWFADLVSLSGNYNSAGAPYSHTESLERMVDRHHIPIVTVTRELLKVSPSWLRIDAPPPDLTEPSTLACMQVVGCNGAVIGKKLSTSTWNDLHHIEKKGLFLSMLITEGF